VTAPEPATAAERVDPRVVQTRRAVYAATLAVIAESGVQAATVERIADRAGVSRSTVYRRWPSLAQLYCEAFGTLARRATQRPRGDTATELLRYLQDYADRLNEDTYCSVLVALLDAAWRDPELAEVRSQLFDQRTSRAAAIVDAGVAAGRLRPDVDRRQVLDAIVAPFLYRRLVEQQPLSRQDVRRLRDDVLTRFGVPAAA
jgi:AcrR family transcriptional regulator